MDITVTTTTHQMLLMTVPRSVVNTAKESTNMPMAIGPIEPGEGSIRRPRRRPATMPTAKPTATNTRAAKKSRLVKMSVQPLRSRLWSLVSTSP